MKALWWALGAGVATGVVLLTVRRSEAMPKSTSYGEPRQAPIPVPEGWRRATNAEVSMLPELRDEALALRSSAGFTSLPYGTLKPFVASDGRTYATWVEQHYHEPGGAIRPWGYHHGVTILSQVSRS